MKSPKKKRLGAGRVAFLARVGAIKEKIDAGHTMASIYEEYQQQLGIGYKQFVNYINKFIRDKRTNHKEKEVQDGNRNESIKPAIEPVAKPAERKKDEGGKSSSIADTLRSTDDLDDFL